jgi:rubrerythrin
MNEKLIIRDGEVDTAVVADYEATRRDAMRRGLLLGGGVIAATSIPVLLRVRNAFAQAGGDAGILEAAIGLEQTAVVAYDTAAASGLLDPPVADVAVLFRDQEQEHADALTTALEDLGGSAPKPPKPGEVQGLGEVKDQSDVLTFAVELENMAVMAYSDAHANLESPDLLASGAQIMANEGQHLVVLRQALGATPAESVPSAFEAGEDPPPKA